MNLQITVSKNELFHKLKAVSRVINTSNKVLPAHGNFLFEIGSELKVTAACEAGNITVKIDCEFTQLEKEISFMADAKTMLDGLKELSEQPLKLCFNTDSYSFEIYHEYGRYKVHALEANFPKIQIDSEESKGFVIDSSDFKTGVLGVIKFVSDDDLRPFTTTVLIAFDNGKITFCGTDAHTLSELKMGFESHLNAEELTLPKKFAKILTELVDSDEINIEFTDRHVCAYFSDYDATFRRVDAKFGNYKSVIPRGNDKILTVDTRLFKSSISRVSVFSNKASSLISLCIKDNKLKISGRDNDFDQLAEETIPVEFSSDEQLEIGFKCGLLMKCIEDITNDEVTITFSDSNRAALVLPKYEDIEQTILIMPMMINT